MNAPRALVVWLMLFAVAFVNGAVREATYRRWMSELRAHQVATLIGITLFAVVIRVMTQVWPFVSGQQAWTVGLVWAAGTMVTEFILGRFVLGHSWPRLLSEYAIWRGRPWVLVLVSLVILPVLCA